MGAAIGVHVKLLAAVAAVADDVSSGRIGDFSAVQVGGPVGREHCFLR